MPVEEELSRFTASQLDLVPAVMMLMLVMMTVVVIGDGVRYARSVIGCGNSRKTGKKKKEAPGSFSHLCMVI